MMRKDCGHLPVSSLRGAWPARRRLGAGKVAVLFSLVFVRLSLAGTVRMWASAVVANDEIRLEEVCELRGFSAQEAGLIARLKVAEAPVAGGSRILSAEQIRAALVGGGVNLAKVTIQGALECEVVRPAASSNVGSNSEGADGALRVNGAVEAGAAEARNRVREANDEEKHRTLREAVIEHFQKQLGRYGGRAEVTFDRASEAILELSEPTYEFSVRQKNSLPLGLCSLEVDVLSQGKVVQVAGMVAQVTLVKEMVTARRTINQGATIGADDVHLAPMSFSRLERLGLDDLSMVIGQRAKQMIPAGSIVERDQIESVPLVMRGQMVTLISQCGGVRIVTSAKAMQEGTIGALIKVRSTDEKHVEFDAVVSGPGEARVVTGRESEAKLAANGK